MISLEIDTVNIFFLFLIKKCIIRKISVFYNISFLAVILHICKIKEFNSFYDIMCTGDDMNKSMTKKRIKKAAIIMLIFIMTAIIIPVSSIVYSGYREYQKAVSDLPLMEYISLIRSQEDYVTIDHISDTLLEATVAIEDRRFYEHNGIDLIGIARAVTDSLIAKNIVSGGSTITQQLAKNLYFSTDYSLERKVAEAFVARQLEKNLSKEEILELYVNIINYGDNHIGIRQASNGYFQKDPIDLTLDEASLLAGLPQSPSNYQLSNHRDAALIRQKQVLNAMVKEKMITTEQMDELNLQK